MFLWPLHQSLCAGGIIPCNCSPRLGWWCLASWPVPLLYWGLQFIRGRPGWGWWLHLISCWSAHGISFQEELPVVTWGSATVSSCLYGVPAEAGLGHHFHKGGLFCWTCFQILLGTGFWPQQQEVVMILPILWVSLPFCISRCCLLCNKVHPRSGGFSIGVMFTYWCLQDGLASAVVGYVGHPAPGLGNHSRTPREGVRVDEGMSPHSQLRQCGKDATLTLSCAHCTTHSSPTQHDSLHSRHLNVYSLTSPLLPVRGSRLPALPQTWINPASLCLLFCIVAERVKGMFFCQWQLSVSFGFAFVEEEETWFPCRPLPILLCLCLMLPKWFLLAGAMDSWS